MDDTRSPEGIDFFDFLYEIWQAKWIFALIVIGCTVLAAAPSFLPGKQPTVVASEDTTAEFGVTIRYYTDIYMRNAGVLLTDFVGQVDPDGALDLQYAGIVNKDYMSEYRELEKTHDRTYAFQFINENNFGRVLLNLKDGDEILYKNVHSEFLRAAEQQFLKAKAFAEGTVESYRKWEQDSQRLWERNPSTTDYPTIPDRVLVALQFLETPEVRDGTLRFFDFKPLEVRTVRIATPPITSSRPAKMIILGALVGFILACVFIMFRIAINRKRNSAAKAG